MDLSTTYLGLKLAHPIICGAGPMVTDLDMVRRLEDNGAAAIVMNSLFEEQIEGEAIRTMQDMESVANSSPEATSYFPQPHEFRMGPDHYLEQLRKIKAAVKIPVIASLNGSSPAGWLKYSEMMQQAGADALELNIYHLPTDPDETSLDVEKRVVESVRMVKESITIPVSVKLLPFYSSLVNLAVRVDKLKVDGLVLFNRIYQPEIDAELLNVVANLQLSSSSELPLRLRWVGILFGRIHASLAISGGVHTPVDVIRSVMAGANAVQVVSAVLRHGPEQIAVMHKGMVAWMEEHEYSSIQEMLGSLSLQFCPDPSGYERGNYARILQSWRG